MLALFHKAPARWTLQYTHGSRREEKPDPKPAEDQAHPSEDNRQEEKSEGVTDIEPDVVRVRGIVTDRVARTGRVNVRLMLHLRVA